METFYKATRPDGTDFYSGTIKYEVGKGVRPKQTTQIPHICGPGMLHASTVPTETLVGRGAWPCRLFKVTGKPIASQKYKRGFRQLQVIEELPAWQVLGPQGEEVATLIEHILHLT